jgi:hypothetical protein
MYSKDIYIGYWYMELKARKKIILIIKEIYKEFINGEMIVITKVIILMI